MTKCKRSVLFFLACLVFPGLAICLSPSHLTASVATASEETSPPPSIVKVTIPYDNIPFVNPNLLSLDIYYNQNATNRRRPVVVYVHGGAWHAGDKSNTQFKDELFTDNGYVFVSVNYRLSPTCPPCDLTSSTAVRFPTHQEDVAKAIRWVYDNIRPYGGDSRRIFLLGHSAGAQIVNIISTNEKFLNGVGLDLGDIGCTCSLDAGVFDVAEEIRTAATTNRRQMLLNAFGLNPANWPAASPLLNISRGEDIPNFLLVHQNSRRFKHNQFVNELQSKGHSGDLFNAFPFNHSQINQLLGDYSTAATMTTEVLDFFQDCRFNWRTSSGEEQTEEALDISPIPTKDWLNIRSRDLDNQQLSLFDLQGRLLTTQTFSGSNTRIDLSNLPEGVYLLTIQEANGKQVMQRKVLKGSVGYR